MAAVTRVRDLEIMKRKMIKSFLFVAALAITIALASTIERTEVIGQSSNKSPDGNWNLRLQLTKRSTLLSSHRVLDADLAHHSNRDWDVRTSIPLEHADAATISNKNPDYPVVWSDDSSAVTYWVNSELKDTIRIEANDERHVFERDLCGLRAVWYPNKDGG